MVKYHGVLKQINQGKYHGILKQVNQGNLPWCCETGKPWLNTMVFGNR